MKPIGAKCPLVCHNSPLPSTTYDTNGRSLSALKSQAIDCKRLKAKGGRFRLLSASCPITIIKCSIAILRYALWPLCPLIGRFSIAKLLPIKELNKELDNLCLISVVNHYNRSSLSKKVDRLETCYA